MSSSILSKHNTYQRIFLFHWSYTYYFEYNATQNIKRVKLHFNPSLHKKTRFMGYQYTMNPSSQMFTIFSFNIHIVRVYLSKMLLHFLSINLLTLPSESPYVHQKRSFVGTSYRLLGLLDTTCYYHKYRSPQLSTPRLSILSYQISWLGRTNEITWTKRSINYPTY